MPENRKQYAKLALSIDEQINLLESRGLIIKDHRRARHYLKFIGYYRLSGYFRFFSLPNDTLHNFKPGTTFDTVLSFYIFDRKLRLLVMDAVERIEVAMRAAVMDIMSIKYGPHWYMERELFKGTFDHIGLMAKVEKETGYKSTWKRNQACRDYFNTYSKPYLPPAWMVAEVLPLGSWSNIFRHLKHRPDSIKISALFGPAPEILASWLHALTYLRNLCAHHERLWNRSFTVKPKIAKKFEQHLKSNHRFSAFAAIINVFLAIIADGSRWQDRLKALFAESPDIPISQMGFRQNWYNDPFWRISG